MREDANMRQELLQIRNIAKSFSGVEVLKDINLTLGKGEIISLVGENGAGKSTLANIISGSLVPDHGMILFEDAEYERLNIRQAISIGISMVHQELNILPKLDVTANIFIGSEINRHGILKSKDMRRKAEELLQTVGLEASPDTRVADIGIAGRQMIEIARALSGDAKVIILDEPTSSLSETETELLFRVVNQLKEKGCSFIFVSHRLKEVLEISDRIYILKDGCMVKELDPKKTTEDEIVFHMVGRSFHDYYNRKRKFRGDEVLRIENFSGVIRPGNTNIKRVPKNVNLHLCAGEVLGIAGLVGAGRTSLLRLIFGMDKKESGQLFLYGKPVQIKNCKSAYDQGIAWVTEDRKKEGLILNFDLKTNIALPIQRLVRKGIFVSERKEDAIAEEYIQKMHVKTTGKRQEARYLSGGNQQKVVIAKWLAGSPRILVLDEPTRGIDVNAKTEIYRLINQLTEQGMAILLISSELMEVMGMSDRIMVMHDGTVTGEFDREEFSEEAIMSCAVGRNRE